MTAVRSRLAKGGLGLLILLVLGLAYAYGGRLLGGSPNPAVSVTGTIEATQVDVSATLAGRIRRLHVTDGDRGAEGQLLAELAQAKIGRGDGG
ncbi:MAG: hypothetical protein AAB265_03015, partial [candidate division NC10 bacterium]